MRRLMNIGWKPITRDNVHIIWINDYPDDERYKYEIYSYDMSEPTTSTLRIRRRID